MASHHPLLRRAGREGAVIALCALLICVAIAGSAHGVAAQGTKPKVLPKLGPCSTTVQQTIYFSDIPGLMSRAKYPATSTVLMYMGGNITVMDPVLLNASFSCTIIKADPALKGVMPFFYHPTNNRTVMNIVNVTNTFFMGIGWKHEWTYEWMPAMRWTGPWIYPKWWIGSDGYFDLWWTWSGVTIYRSFNVLISQCTILGRLDIIRSGSVEVSYSFIYVDSDFWQGINGTRNNMGYGWNWCAVRLMLCGDNVNLIRANNKIAHNYIRGSSTTVFLYWGAVGNIIQNNYITGYGFGGLQCGQMMVNVADCMLNTFELNYITPDPNIPTDGDGAGIYYDLHWFNPGNRDSCNYQINTTRCYYIDYCTSGVLVEGAVCVYGSTTGLGITDNNLGGGNGIKLNTGKFNVFRSVVMVSNGKRFRLGWLSCQNWCYNRCGGNNEGKAWWAGYLSKYNNAMWQRNYPLLQGVCTDMGYTFKGKYYLCNPGIATVPNPGSPLPDCYENMTVSNNKTGTYYSPGPGLTGNCSGIPMLNDFQSLIFVSNFTSTNPGSFYYNLYQLYIDSNCKPMGNFVPGTNNVPLNTKTWAPKSLGFNDENNFDYGADDPSSRVYQAFPDFYSCPKRLAGPQTAPFARSRHASNILKKFNRFRPAWMRKAVDRAYFQERTMKQYARKFKRAAPFLASQ